MIHTELAIHILGKHQHVEISDVPAVPDVGETILLNVEMDDAVLNGRFTVLSRQWVYLFRRRREPPEILRCELEVVEVAPG